MDTTTKTPYEMLGSFPRLVAAEVLLARAYRMLFRYECEADEMASCPAWLSTLGQMDCRIEIELLETEIAKLKAKEGTIGSNA